MRNSHGISIFLFILFGVFLGTKGIETALLVISPFFLLWFMGWDEKRYRQFMRRKKAEEQYHYHNHHHSL